jgi:hypothetical protein
MVLGKPEEQFTNSLPSKNGAVLHYSTTQQYLAIWDHRKLIIRSRTSKRVSLTLPQLPEILCVEDQLVRKGEVS